MRLLIVGAGASAGALGLPVARDFGAELQRVRPRWRRAYPELASVVRRTVAGPDGGWDLGAAWTRLDYAQKLGWALEIEPKRRRERALVQLRRALVDVYGRTRPRRGTRSVLHQALARLRPGDGVISFNYDLVVEEAARGRVRLVQAPCRRCAGPHRCVQLVKPHGSLSWLVEGKGQEATVRWSGPRGRPRTKVPAPGKIRGESAPLVLGVVPLKSELLPEPESAVHAAIARQWRVAVGLANQADAIDVLGYSFPPEDTYAAFLFREAMRGRARPPEVSYHELEIQAFDVAQRLLEIFGVWPTWRRQVF